ncbi:glycosyltransferase family 4 protein [Micropruina sp.]|uniref:glycosyltransferase family 4 protein n=1 Tax=Micropruina sp. TaxID=2737536 RepID=UPI0039E34709
MRIAYLTGEYPRATDTFIQREILAVERVGVEVERFSVRRTGDEHMVGPQQVSERAATTYLLSSPSTMILRDVWAAARRSPKRFLATLKLALSTRRLGVGGALKQAAYFIEAAHLAEELHRRAVTHLHNHFSDACCTVAMLASELSGIPFSFTLHGPGIFFEANEWKLGTKIDKSVFCATISSFARAQASLFCSADGWRRVRIVHCGVEIPEINPDAAREDGPPRLLFVGRLDQVKGVTVLFDAVAELATSGTPLELTLVGDGPQRPELERRVAELGIGDAVHFTGYQSQSAVQEHLRRCDVFVLPSFAEGVPVSLMEAMAQGKPVIATNVGGVTELVADGVNGRVVVPGSVSALREAVAGLVADEQLRARLGAAGRERVAAEFASDTEARRLVTLFRAAEDGALGNESADEWTERPAPYQVGG